MWARTNVCPHSLELVSKVSTHVATKAPKLLATAALNRKVDRCSMFSALNMAPFWKGCMTKKNSDLLSVVS